MAEALNGNIREQLKGYQQFLTEADATHKADLEKLIEKTEAALKLADFEEKQKTINELPQSFTPEFNTWINTKLEEFQVNDDIHEAIEFYASLNAGSSDYKAETEKTIATLENLLKETDLQKKETDFTALNAGFSPEFNKFLMENALPKINRELKKTAEFFEDLLVEKNGKYETEIKALKAQAEAALGDISVDDKQKALFEVTNPKDKALFEYLQTKFIEAN